jgi:hypothetical protein
MPLSTNPVTAIPARVASINGGNGSGSSGIPTFAQAIFVARPNLELTAEFTITLALIAG